MKETNENKGPMYLVKHTLGGFAIPGTTVSYAALKEKYRDDINIQALVRDKFIQLSVPEPDVNDREGKANKAAQSLINTQKKAKAVAPKKVEKPVEAEVVAEPEAPAEEPVEDEASKAKLEGELKEKTVAELNQIISDECELKNSTVPTSWPYSMQSYAISYIMKNLT